MNKVIYVGNYRDGTGWGNAALNNILAMDSVGIDVIPRCISFGGNPVIVPEKILELEQKDSGGAEVCIQHTLPPLYHANKNFKNIALYETESDFIGDAMWNKFINLLDEAWVPNQRGLETSHYSGVKIPVEVVPHCLDITQYNRSDDGKIEIPELDGTFNFLFIGEMVERKNLEALLKAFHSEFHPTENARLVIKTSIPNVPPEHQFDIAAEFTTNVKDRLKIRNNYSGDVIICDRIDRVDYLALIKQCHCFVMPSRGEACCIPALEAGALGVPVLYTSNNGMEDYVDVGSRANSILSTKTPCYNSMDTIPDLHTGMGSWQEISVLRLREEMRKIYRTYNQTRPSYDELCEKQRKKSEEFSYEKVGEIIKEKLK